VLAGRVSTSPLGPPAKKTAGATIDAEEVPALCGLDRRLQLMK